MKALVACAVFFLCACGSSSEEDVCEPGQQRACQCPGDGGGRQDCRDDGSGWEDCDCPCIPGCEGRECGSDGCGGTCLPGCSGTETCNQITGTCGSCSPRCADKCCGDDGCGGQCPDTCHLTGQVCDPATCQCEGTCQPVDCAVLSKECGGPYDDGCGDDLFCGDCGPNERCTADGRCESACEFAVCGDVCCARGEACCDGSCTPDRCLIDGGCVAAGAFDGADPCQVCLPGQNTSAWTYDSHNPTCEVPAHYWEGVSRQMAVTPRGHVAAVSCHNCYHQPGGGDTSSSSLTRTLQRVHDARSRGADLIELDIMQTGADVFVSHEDNGATNGAFFRDVLADDALSAGDQVLFIEMKETAPTEAFLQAVLSSIQQQGYASPGRPVVLRAFHDLRSSLVFARDLLATLEYEALRPHVRLQVLFGGNQGTQDLMLESRARGFHGIEIHYQDRNLSGKLAFARGLDMGTNLWTIPSQAGEVFVAAFREEVDAITVDYPVDRARYVVQDHDLLAYLNVWDQGDSTDTVRYHRTGPETFEVAIHTAGTPTMEHLGAGHNRFGGALVFDASREQSLGLYDADNLPGEGFLVTAAVDFDDLALGEGETNAILNKSDAGGFALELFNPPDGPAVLRFGVFVGGYRYATYPASLLNGEDIYLLIGAYDGDGSVHLWVNNRQDHVVTTPASGGVGHNDSPVVLGADPQGATGRGFFFSGKIQQAMVLTWGGDGH